MSQKIHLWYNTIIYGPLAQLGARFVRNEEVVGSNPIWSIYRIPNSIVTSPFPRASSIIFLSALMCPSLVYAHEFDP